MHENALTIGFARRFATYKRATLLFRDLDRLKRIVNNPDRPVQFIFAGKAHPADNPGKEFIQQLWQFSQKWTRQSSTAKEREARQYAHDYMLWLVHTGMRVDEALKVRYEDVHEVHRKLPESVSEADYFYVWVKGGKLSYLKRPTEMIGLYGAVRAFDRLKARNPKAKPKDLLFPINPATTIRQLLDAAGLLNDERGERRTAKSFRHTYIMFRLLANVDVYSLAQNCRTSVKMIQQHYGSYLNARMKRVELTKFLPRQDSDQRREG